VDPIYRKELSSFLMQFDRSVTRKDVPESSINSFKVPSALYNVFAVVLTLYFLHKLINFLREINVSRLLRDLKDLVLKKKYPILALTVVLGLLSFGYTLHSSCTLERVSPCKVFWKTMLVFYILILLKFR
jgi:hypothetical protein